MSAEAGKKPTKEQIIAYAKRARAKVALGLCQRAYSKDKDGHHVAPTNADAVCYCTTSALISESQGHDYMAYRAPVTDALEKTQAYPAESRAAYHDSLPSLEAVLAWWDRALVYLEELP